MRSCYGLVTAEISLFAERLFCCVLYNGQALRSRTAMSLRLLLQRGGVEPPLRQSVPLLYVLGLAAWARAAAVSFVAAAAAVCPKIVAFVFVFYFYKVYYYSAAKEGYKFVGGHFGYFFASYVYVCHVVAPLLLVFRVRCFVRSYVCNIPYNVAYVITPWGDLLCFFFLLSICLSADFFVLAFGLFAGIEMLFFIFFIF